MISAWILAFGAGLLLGGINFWGLHASVRKAVGSPQPGRIFLLSLGLRMSLLLPSFALVARYHPLYLLVCLVGFVIARKVVLSWTADQPEEAARAH